MKKKSIKKSKKISIDVDQFIELSILAHELVYRLYEYGDDEAEQFEKQLNKLEQYHA